MSTKYLSFLILGLVLGGCTLIAAPPSPTPAFTLAASPSLIPVAESPTALPSSIPTATQLPTQIPEAVKVAAAKGNLFIRRGPDSAFNATSVLLDGQSEPVLARDVLAKWVQIPIPGQPEKTGWISIQTRYSLLSGDVRSLPEVAPTDWPILAFLRNCTYDQMLVEPGGVVLPSLRNFPLNDVQINPGIYRIYDTDVNDNPEVLKVEVREGSAIDVRVDGNGGKRKCPVP